MKKLTSIIFLMFLLSAASVYAQENLTVKDNVTKTNNKQTVQQKKETNLKQKQLFRQEITLQTGAYNFANDIKMQNKISDIGFKILNANKIDSRLIFTYKRNNSKIKGEPILTKRQVIVYDDTIKYASNDAEIAAYLAREIAKGVESHYGVLHGIVRSAQVKMAPKKFELFFDKRAVDYLVVSGYNPLSLITFLNKSGEQKRFEIIFSQHNLTSKRLENIYEYIYKKYPVFLTNNEYIHNEYYQNFLLNSVESREKLHEKVKRGEKESTKHE